MLCVFSSTVVGAAAAHDNADSSTMIAQDAAAITAENDGGEVKSSSWLRRHGFGDVGCAVTAHRKVLKSAGLALAWYLMSSTMALAAEAVAVGVVGAGGSGAAQLASKATQRKASARNIGMLLILYIFSNKTVKTRGRQAFWGTRHIGHRTRRDNHVPNEVQSV